ncbi:MAG: GNAT family N-acetyltransferase [Candidatus Limnocylindrales bacterium]
MDEPEAVRSAVGDDLESVVGTIALAFADDPVWSPALGPRHLRDEHRAAFWRLWIAGAMRYPWTWVVGDAAAVSVWIPPGGTDMSHEQERELSRLAAAVLGPAADDLNETLSRFEAAHPRDEPHYYLSLLATHPEHRGRGLGMALLAQNLARIDAESVPAYLESTNPANDKRYASVGFQPVGSFKVPYDGAIVTTMWRPARTYPPAD